MKIQAQSQRRLPLKELYKQAEIEGDRPTRELGDSIMSVFFGGSPPSATGLERSFRQQGVANSCDSVDLMARLRRTHRRQAVGGKVASTSGVALLAVSVLADLSLGQAVSIGALGVSALAGGLMSLSLSETPKQTLARIEGLARRASSRLEGLPVSLC